MTEPSTRDLEEYALPPDVSKQFHRSFGLDETPRTLRAWVEATSGTLEETFQHNFDELYTPEQCRQEVRLNATVYNCRGLFDALVLPFISDETGAFQVRSRSPFDGTPIDLCGSSNEISVQPADAVMSFGVAENVVPFTSEVPPHIAHFRFSQYTHAFPDEQTYDRWCARTDDVVTMALPMSLAVSLAQSVTAEWQEPEEVPAQPTVTER